MTTVFLRLICCDSLCHTVIPDPHAAIKTLEVSGHFVATTIVVTVGEGLSTRLFETTAWGVATLGESTHAVFKAHAVFRGHLPSRKVEHHGAVFLVNAFFAVL